MILLFQKIQGFLLIGVNRQKYHGIDNRAGLDCLKATKLCDIIRQLIWSDGFTKFTFLR